ncbi:MAG: DUF2442 domain-containing protein [Magnetococcus sp. DMHC-1]|nr:DUF2442 domain-containing protein [Magnetococcales bacterium]
MNMQRIASVRAIPGTLSLVVTWQNGTKNLVDMTSVIRRSAPLQHLADTTKFAEVAVIDWGCAIGWHGDLGYGADTLLEHIHQQTTNHPQTMHAAV